MVNFKDDEAFREQVDVLVRVQQEIISTTTIVLLQCCQEVVDIEVRERYLDVSLFHILAVHVPQILIESIKTGCNAVVSTYQLDIGVYGRTKFTCLGLSDMLISTFPEREQQRTDTLSLLYIEEVIIRIKRVEGYRTFIGIGEIHAVLTFGLAVDKFTQALI